MKHNLMEQYGGESLWKWCGDSLYSRPHSVRKLVFWLSKSCYDFKNTFPITISGVTSIISEDNKQLLQRVPNTYKYEVLLDGEHNWYCSNVVGLNNHLNILKAQGIALGRVEVETI